MQNKYQHLIFDLDRTLWDFESNARIALNEIYNEYGLKERGVVDFDGFEKKYKEINEVCWDDYRNGKLKKEILRNLRFELTLKEYGISDRKTILDISELYLYKSPRLTKVIEGAHDILDYLSGSYQLHILTNGFVEVQGIKMDKSGLAPYFDQVVASEFAGAKKPHPQAFEFTLERINAKADNCLMIGDDPISDIKGAHNVGIDSVYFNPDNNSPSVYATYTIQKLMELKSIL
ncbi:MAG: noncanonical pyrimidine nucleotidase, YjjG family [Bacteroidetes bacterium]|nr:MAG: noncanonical pyrimidine nucleotidase, YjjG family [Bacteroidota bacterium]